MLPQAWPGLQQLLLLNAVESQDVCHSLGAFSQLQHLYLRPAQALTIDLACLPARLLSLHLSVACVVDSAVRGTVDLAVRGAGAADAAWASGVVGLENDVEALNISTPVATAAAAATSSSPAATATASAAASSSPAATATSGASSQPHAGPRLQAVATAPACCYSPSPVLQPDEASPPSLVHLEDLVLCSCTMPGRALLVSLAAMTQLKALELRKVEGLWDVHLSALSALTQLTSLRVHQEELLPQEEELLLQEEELLPQEGELLPQEVERGGGEEAALVDAIGEGGLLVDQRLGAELGPEHGPDLGPGCGPGVCAGARGVRQLERLTQAGLRQLGGLRQLRQLVWITRDAGRGGKRDVCVCGGGGAWCVWRGRMVCVGGVT